jgi:hypothetical protein
MHWLRDILLRRKRVDRVSKSQADQLIRSYDNSPEDLPYRESIRGRELTIFSQNGEDGLLFYIFSQVGVTNKTFVEFGIETGKECNTAALIRYFDWNGLLMDGGEKNIRKAREFYSDCESYKSSRLRICQCFVTTDNINQVISENGIEEEIDLLSIDIDGNDYWVWDAIQIVNPRVIVIEYNASFGTNRSITIPYDPAFRRFTKHKSGWYHGASITALAALGQKKQYHLVCADSNGCNVFFVRHDVLGGDLQKQTAAEAFYPQPKRSLIATLEQQFELIKDLDYVNVC